MLPALPHTRRPGRTLWVAARSVIGSGSGVLDGVLHLLAGVLEAGLGLVGATGGLQLLVVGGPADGLLGLALQILALVAKLVVGAHGRHHLQPVACPPIGPPNLVRGPGRGRARPPRPGGPRPGSRCGRPCGARGGRPARRRARGGRWPPRSPPARSRPTLPRPRPAAGPGGRWPR